MNTPVPWILWVGKHGCYGIRNVHPMLGLLLLKNPVGTTWTLQFGCLTWFRCRLVNSPSNLRLNWHPLEGAGTCIYCLFNLNSRPERPFGECPLLNQGAPMVISWSLVVGEAPDRAGWSDESPDSWDPSPVIRGVIIFYLSRVKTLFTQPFL